MFIVFASLGGVICWFNLVWMYIFDTFSGFNGLDILSYLFGSELCC